MDAFFDELTEATERLEKAMQTFIDNMPSVKKKLLHTERQASEADGLDYTDEEIEELVAKQLENHPFSNDLVRAYEAMVEVWT